MIDRKRELFLYDNPPDGLKPSRAERYVSLGLGDGFKWTPKEVAMRSNHDLSAVVLALQELDCPVDVLEVGAILTKHGVTVDEFLHLTNSPINWGYDRSWHYKLQCFHRSDAIRSYRFTKEDESC
jgi:hypothetical protein